MASLAHRICALRSCCLPEYQDGRRPASGPQPLSPPPQGAPFRGRETSNLEHSRFISSMATRLFLQENSVSVYFHFLVSMLLPDTSLGELS